VKVVIDMSEQTKTSQEQHQEQIEWQKPVIREEYLGELKGYFFYPSPNFVKTCIM
jgi:hypothetical protein